ncbi:helix-turn-helix domain-containing protein [Halobacteria archaeon AArc-m2/3/4]|uniref:Helix-turn-helix domain-containing protein n=1 Tax=Natronoglomus mannanivorans TaxID=2979990 RepID=A0AAP3E260_9EURY|nr:helix-turn-helix domain-containing protein [Halobacteria archaeon AArc-xg1-1]MCU4975786.1 helix-turn-helix domain-containing protein [Halobacteria archaeon AArc-m2/3/4]
MSLFGEFHVPADAFALSETLRAEPELVIEIERVVATDEVLTPYFWISDCAPDDFEQAAAADPSIADLRRIDTLDRATLYRAEWTDDVETIVYAYTAIGATVLEASAQYTDWQLRIRFTDRDRLDQFRDYCAEHDIPFQLTQLFERAHPRAGGQYGLTVKQHEALVTAWELEYFTSSDVSLADVAEALGITQQSVSQRLQQGYL